MACTCGYGKKSRGLGRPHVRIVMSSDDVWRFASPLRRDKEDRSGDECVSCELDADVQLAVCRDSTQSLRKK